MADQKQGDQPQGGQPKGDQPKGGQPQGGPPADVRKAQEQAQEQVKKAQNKAQEYQQKLAALNQKIAEGRAAHDKNQSELWFSHQDALREIYEGGRKRSAVPQPSENSSPEKDFEAFKAARAKNVHVATDLDTQLRSAVRQYEQKAKGFWDDFDDLVKEAVTEFWDWIIGWWEEPPVEGGGGGRGPRHFADPAFRAAFDQANAAYYSGWNYGAQLY